MGWKFYDNDGTILAGTVTTVTEVEENFGSTPVEYAEFTVTDGQVTANSQVVAQMSGNTPTSGTGDENETDPLVCACVPAAGSFTLQVQALDGPITGYRKFIYQVY